MFRIGVLVCCVLSCRFTAGDEPLAVWPNVAPGEATRLTGEPVPPREDE